MEMLCKIRKIYRLIIDFESSLEKTYNISLNEGMLLCNLQETTKLSSGQIAEILGLSPSNTSKIIRSVENKGLIERALGDKDKRQMYFILTPLGKNKVNTLNCEGLQLPEDLRYLIINK